jgi:hypothetical protein
MQAGLTLGTVVSALVRVRNKIRRPDARIAFAMPPRIGTNTTEQLKCVYLFCITYNWKSLTFCTITWVKQRVIKQGFYFVAIMINRLDDVCLYVPN